jgi:ATP-dependent Clp protease ATP-binding subunit ClpX
MLDIMYDAPSRSDLAAVTINRSVVEGKRPPILRRRSVKKAA